MARKRPPKPGFLLIVRIPYFRSCRMLSRYVVLLKGSLLLRRFHAVSSERCATVRRAKSSFQGTVSRFGTFASLSCQ
jgi:hypothetical protein